MLWWFLPLKTEGRRRGAELPDDLTGVREDPETKLLLRVVELLESSIGFSPDVLWPGLAELVRGQISVQIEVVPAVLKRVFA